MTKKIEEKICDESCKKSTLETILYYLFGKDKYAARTISAGIALGIAAWSIKAGADDILKLATLFK